MKKLLIVLTLCLYVFLIGCKSDSTSESTESNTTEVESNESKDTEKEATETDSNAVTDEDTDTEASEESTATENEASTELVWPEEFALWNVPIVENVTLTAANNKSVSGDVLTQGLVAVVEITGLDMQGFKAYGETLINEGFALDPTSVPGAIEYYTRESATGVITLTMAFGDDRSSIIVNNTGAEAEKEASSTSPGSDTWPETLSDIPEFNGGTFKEVIDMTGGMYTITYTDVTQEALDTYKKELSNKGYAMEEDQGSEMYFLFDGTTSYAVGFNTVDSTLQLIVMISTN